MPSSRYGTVFNDNEKQSNIDVKIFRQSSIIDTVTFFDEHEFEIAGAAFYPSANAGDIFSPFIGEKLFPGVDVNVPGKKSLNIEETFLTIDNYSFEALSPAFYPSANAGDMFSPFIGGGLFPGGGLNGFRENNENETITTTDHYSFLNAGPVLYPGNGLFMSGVSNIFPSGGLL